MNAVLQEECGILIGEQFLYMQFDVTVIGAGPAGLFCALHAAASGRRVLLLEKMDAPGAKLLLSGLGQCNITHDGGIENFFSHYGEHGMFKTGSL
jgi:predicted flavoprotein YhiN